MSKARAGARGEKECRVMPILLILGPIFGIAAIAMLVAHGHKGSGALQGKAPAQAQATQQFELDHGMPEAVVHQVLTALVHDQEPSQLEALARELSAKYPLAASELHAKATTLRGGASAIARASLPLPPFPAGAQQQGGAPTGAASSADMGEAALILQAAMKAYAQETDPVELEGFAESIRTKYPTATVLLVGRARELRAAQTAADAAGGTPPAGVLGSLAMPSAVPSPTKPTTYQVQAGDTPTVIAEKLARDGRRWPELVAANPAKPTAPDGSFASLRAGETLHVPPTWNAPMTSPAHTNGLPKEAHL